MTLAWGPKEKMVYETEQKCLPPMHRDCTECMGRGEIPPTPPEGRRPLYYGPYTSSMPCSSCGGTGNYVVQQRQPKALYARKIMKGNFSAFDPLWDK